MSFKKFSSRQGAPANKPAEKSNAAAAADQSAKQPDNKKPVEAAPAGKS